MVFLISFTGQDLEPRIRIRIRKPDPHPWFKWPESSATRDKYAIFYNDLTPTKATHLSPSIPTSLEGSVSLKLNLYHYFVALEAIQEVLRRKRKPSQIEPINPPRGPDLTRRLKTKNGLDRSSRNWFRVVSSELKRPRKRILTIQTNPKPPKISS